MNDVIKGTEVAMRKEDIPYLIGLIMSTFLGAFIGTFISNLIR